MYIRNVQRDRRDKVQGIEKAEIAPVTGMDAIGFVYNRVVGPLRDPAHRDRGADHIFQKGILRSPG